MDDSTFGKVMGKTAANLLTFGVGGPAALLGKVFVEYSIRAAVSDADDNDDREDDDRRNDKE